MTVAYFLFTEVEKKVRGSQEALQPQSSRNQNAIEQIETPLNEECEQRRRNGALQDCCVIV